MGQQNTMYPGPMLDLEPQQVHPHPEPGVVLTCFPQPYNSRTILPPPGNRSSFDPRYLPGNHGHLPYVITQFNGEHCNTFMMPLPSAGVFAVPVNQGCYGHSPFSSNHQIFERNGNLFMEGYNGGFKRKNIVGFPGNYQWFYPEPGSSSSVSVPLTSEGMEPGLNRSVRNRATGTMVFDPMVVHNNSHLIYGGQPVQAVPPPWSSQHGVTGAFPWDHAHGAPRLQGRISGSGMEAANMALHGYRVAAMSRTSVAFLQPPPHLYHPPPPMPPLQAQNMDIHSHLASTSNTHSTTTTNPYQNRADLGPRSFGPTPPTALRIYEPQRQELVLEPSASHQSFPHLRVLPEDELLALGEQIEDVGSGLSDSFISDNLKTKTFTSSRSSDLEDQVPAGEEPNICVVCQMEFENEEKMGVLECSHEYHAECIKKWLIVKNNCPICKSTALALITT